MKSGLLVFFRKAELLCITSWCPVIILNGINGECSICNAVLLLLSVAYVASVLQFHAHFLAQILDYLQVLIIVNHWKQWLCVLQSQFKSNFKIFHYVFIKLKKKSLLCNCPPIFCISSAHTFTVDRVSLVQTTQETIPFTTVAFPSMASF